jgi:hypothetical protein
VGQASKNSRYNCLLLLVKQLSSVVETEVHLLITTIGKTALFEPEPSLEDSARFDRFSLL